MNKHLRLLCFVCTLLLAGCSALPDNSGKTSSYAISSGSDTFLGQTAARLIPDDSDESGAFLLTGGLDAFVARIVLAELAETSIDVQYYIFHQDTIGKLLLRSLLRAADRGVRVRLLIDDIYGDEADDVWTTLDSHPEIEVRLFNPFVRSTPKMLQFLTRLSDVNYRMHSKSFTVDNQATIVGGRNIGNEYFDADQDLAFADIDVLAIGPVVPPVSAAFDQYWNNRYAYPAPLLSQPAPPEAIGTMREELERYAEDQSDSAYVEALRESPFARQLRTGSLRFDLTKALVIHDSPEKKERSEGWERELLISQLWPYIKEAETELLIISPYFVPGKRGAEALAKLSEQGVKVAILTNSLASNDVSAVHAGYKKYRKQLLKAGVVLYELDLENRENLRKRFSWLPGLSKSSLHAKAMDIDRKALFVGSMNLDLRSLNINNEIGILLFNEEMAARSAANFWSTIDQVAFKVTLAHNGSLRWTINRDGAEVVYEDEPYVGLWSKFVVWLLGLLPIESLL